MRQACRIAVSVLVALLLVSGGFLGWLYWQGRPLGHVRRPDTGASPDATALAYVDAINARDYRTSNAMIVGPQLISSHWWDWGHAHFSDVHLTYPDEVLAPHAEPYNDWQHIIVVQFWADRHEPEGYDVGAPLDVIVVRNNDTEPWKVASAGVY